MSINITSDLLKGWTVLVVDDELDSLMIAEGLLSRAGAEVLVAQNGAEGLALAKRHRPRFIVSDLSMPEMDGWQMHKALKADLATAEIPVIALTAHAMSGDREKAISVGFHNYLTKPLMPYTFVKDVIHLIMDVPELADLLFQQQQEKANRV